MCSLIANNSLRPSLLFSPSSSYQLACLNTNFSNCLTMSVTASIFFFAFSIVYSMLRTSSGGINVDYCIWSAISSKCKRLLTSSCSRSVAYWLAGPWSFVPSAPRCFVSNDISMFSMSNSRPRRLANRRRIESRLIVL